ncbi:MAG: YceK/YidQ family lipoprotein, partial [Leptospiraceae bacterium]|nr:YceK/YidQ family lipoprotein [Leptospiraceae bacterium]
PFFLHPRSSKPEGTRLDLALVTDGNMHGSIDGIVWFLALVDLPLSLTLDTALLPVIVIADITIPQRKSDGEDEGETAEIQNQESGGLKVASGRKRATR